MRLLRLLADQPVLVGAAAAAAANPFSSINAPTIPTVTGNPPDPGESSLSAPLDTQGAVAYLNDPPPYQPAPSLQTRHWLVQHHAEVAVLNKAVNATYATGISLEMTHGCALLPHDIMTGDGSTCDRITQAYADSAGISYIKRPNILVRTAVGSGEVQPIIAVAEPVTVVLAKGQHH
jgi:hypothetical protein